MQTNRLKKRSRIPYEDMLANILKNDRNVSDEQFKKARKIYQESLLCKSKDNIPKVPTTINIELVNKFNYACKMCYTVNHQGVKNQLSKETLFSIIDQASELGIFTVMFGMGSEATLHPNLLEVLTYACKRIPDVILFTNGSRIKPKDVYKYVETGVTRICISLDAADQEIYKLIRGGNLEEVEEVIDQFNEPDQRARILLVPQKLIIYTTALNLDLKIYKGVFTKTVPTLRKNPHIKTTDHKDCLNAYYNAQKNNCFDCTSLKFYLMEIG